MGTRYEIGDQVYVGDEMKAQVVDIKNPESDSPDYEVEYNTSGLIDEVKASDMVKAEDTVDLEIATPKQQGKNEPIFYRHRDEIAYYNPQGDVEYLLQVVGEVRAEVKEGKYSGRVYNEDETIELIEDLRITDDEKLAELEDSGKLVFSNNCWFELYKREGNNWHSTDLVIHNYDRAIERMKKYIREDN